MDISTLANVPAAPGLDVQSLKGRAAVHDEKSLKAAANGFESMFFSLILKEMRQTLEPDTLFGQDNGDVLGGLFDLFLGQHLAQSNALGIGAMVAKQLSETSHDGVANPAPTRARQAHPSRS